MAKSANNILKNLWVLKEGAIVGLLAGLGIYFLKLNFILDIIQKTFGPFNGNQLLITTLYLCVSIGIIIDAVWKPNK